MLIIHEGRVRCGCSFLGNAASEEGQRQVVSPVKCGVGLGFLGPILAIPLPLLPLPAMLLPLGHTPAMQSWMSLCWLT